VGARAPRTLALTSVALAVAALLVGATAGAEPPTGGTFTPGSSLAGVELGMTSAQVLDTWGERHGECRDCRQTTWYYNENPFQPEGAGVIFRGGRVVHVFTVWKPEGWSTPEGLMLGQQAGEIGATYGELAEEDCVDYIALVREDATATSAFYVYDKQVWGFGLMVPGRSPCL
jgi:hypothetical protein